MNKNKSNDPLNPFRAAVLVSIVGADLAICLLAGYYGGGYVDKWLGTDMLWSLIGLIIGLFAGIISVIVLINKFTEAP